MMDDEKIDSEKIKSVFVPMMEEMLNMAQCIIPLNDEDKKIINDGISSLEQYKNDLKNADSLRELNRYIDVNKYIEDEFHLRTKVDEEATYTRYTKFMNSVEGMVNNDV